MEAGGGAARHASRPAHGGADGGSTAGERAVIDRRAEMPESEAANCRGPSLGAVGDMAIQNGMSAPRA